jgi:hypothetical protein
MLESVLALYTVSTAYPFYDIPNRISTAVRMLRARCAQFGNVKPPTRHALLHFRLDRYLAVSERGHCTIFIDPKAKEG